MHLSDAIIRAIVPLHVQCADEERMGTAFWFQRSEHEAPHLVTAAHVVRDAERIRVGTGGAAFTVDPTAVRMRPEVDLATLHPEVRPSAWLESSWIARPQTLAAIEPIVVLGHPLGLVDEASGTPIARSGITATDPKVPFRGRPEFLVDAPCYPGSSGSPVLRYAPSEPVPIALLGILIGGPALRQGARTGILSDWPTGDTFHLGVAVDARYLTA